MLNGIFLINTLGDVLVHKTLVISKYHWGPELFFQRGIRKTSEHILPLCIKIEKVYYIHSKLNDVYVVAATSTENTSPFLMVASLNDFVNECSTLIGDFTSHNILQHIAVVYELVTQTFGLSHPTCVTPLAISECKQMGKTAAKEGKIFPFVPNNLFGVVPAIEERYIKAGSASRAPLATQQQEKSDEIFVDLTEYLNVVMDSNGQVLHTDLKGGISTKSYLSSPVNLQITLSDKIVDGASATKGGIVMTEKRFHSLVNSAEESQRQKDFPLVKHVSKPGLSHVLDYNISSESLTLPFTMYHNFTKTPKGSMIELSLHCKLFCALPLGVSPINWSASFPLPSKVISTRAVSTLKSVSFSENKENSILLMNSPIFPSQSHHSVTITLLISEVLPYMMYEMPFINLQFEVPNLCVSNMKIQGLKVESITSNAAPTLSKWVRCSTHCKNYQFELKSDWM